MNKPVKEFFNDEFAAFSIYSSYRSIASYIDGLKPSSRKVVYTVKKTKLKDPVRSRDFQPKFRKLQSTYTVRIRLMG